MISESDPEPLCDVTAQLAALRDPAHPKGAVWLARGTPAPEIVDELIVVHHDAGVLLTLDPEKAERFSADPSDATLADLLEYVEPKGSVAGVPIVVQACTPEGAVVHEMACSLDAFPRAVDIAQRYGAVRAIGLGMALNRRGELCRREAM